MSLLGNPRCGNPQATDTRLYLVQNLSGRQGDTGCPVHRREDQGSDDTKPGAQGESSVGGVPKAQSGRQAKSLFNGTLHPP